MTGQIPEAGQPASARNKLLIACMLLAMIIMGILIRLVLPRSVAEQPISVVLMRFNTPHTGLIHIAEAKGFFTDAGLAVTVKPMQVGTEAVAKVLAGEADFGTTAETPVAMALAEGKQPRIVATIFSSRWSSGIVVRKDHGILKPEDLVGKRIGFVLGTNTQYDLETFMAFHNVPVNSVTMVQEMPKQMVADLVAGKIDAASIWIPHMTEMQKRLGDKVQTFLRDEAYAQTLNLIVRPGYVATHREAVDRMLRALLKAEEFVTDHPDEAYAIIARESNIDPSILRGHGEPLTYELTLKQSLLMATENQVHWFFRRGIVPPAPFPDVLDAFETEPLRALKPAEVTISK